MRGGTCGDWTDREIGIEKTYFPCFRRAGDVRYFIEFLTSGIVSGQNVMISRKREYNMIKYQRAIMAGSLILETDGLAMLVRSIKRAIVLNNCIRPFEK